MEDYIDTKMLVLGEEELKELLKEKYPDAQNIQLYIDYDEEAEGNNPIIAEVHIPVPEDEKREPGEKFFSKELEEIFNKMENEGNKD